MYVKQNVKVPNWLYAIMLISMIDMTQALHARTKIYLDDNFLHMADGLPGVMDAMAFKECFDTRKHIITLMYTPLILQNHTLEPLKELVLKEIEYAKTGKLESPEYQQLWHDLLLLKNEFFRITNDLHKELMEKELQQGEYLRLINLFFEKINRKDTLLKNLGKPNEYAILSAVSARDFF